MDATFTNLRRVTSFEAHDIVVDASEVGSGFDLFLSSSGAREADIFTHSEKIPEDNVVALRYIGKLRQEGVWIPFIDRVSADEDLPCIGQPEAGNEAAESGFTRSGGADNADNFAGSNI